MADKPSRANEIRSLTEGLERLSAMQEQMVTAARQIQDVVVFHDHPDVVALDDELDIMHRGQL